MQEMSYNTYNITRLRHIMIWLCQLYNINMMKTDILTPWPLLSMSTEILKLQNPSLVSVT